MGKGKVFSFVLKISPYILESLVLGAFSIHFQEKSPGNEIVASETPRGAGQPAGYGHIPNFTVAQETLGPRLVYF